MTIKREGRDKDIIFVCDIGRCRDEYNTETDEFGDALKRARKKNWEFKKVGDEWVHACPRCML